MICLIFLSSGGGHTNCAVVTGGPTCALPIWGVNVCEMAWQDALGLPVYAAGPDYVVGAGCVNLQRDINAVRGQSRQAREPWSKILRQWARAHSHTFRFDAPLPALSSAWRIATHRTGSQHGPGDAPVPPGSHLKHPAGS